MIKLFGAPKTRATRISWCLEELNQPYDYVLIDFAKGGARSPEFLSINPAGKVPAISDEDGRVILESGAILNYLAQRFAAGEFIPTEAYERAIYDQWSQFALTELEQPLWTIGKHKFALPRDKRVFDVIETAHWEFQQALGLLSDALGDSDFIMGRAGEHWNRFTPADILIAHTLLWGKAFKQPIEQKNLLAYMDRMFARESFKKAIEFESSQQQ